MVLVGFLKPVLFVTPSCHNLPGLPAQIVVSLSLVNLVPFQPRLALSGSDTNWSRLSLARQDILWSTLISEGISSLL